MKRIYGLLLLLYTFQFAMSLNCDKVATLPENIQTLLPLYEKLSRFHIQNYFFIENNANQTIKFTVIDKSIFK